MKASNLKLVSANNEGILYQVDFEFIKIKGWFKKEIVKETRLIFLESIGKTYSQIAVYYDTGEIAGKHGDCLHLANIIKHDFENTKSKNYVHGKINF